MIRLAHVSDLHIDERGRLDDVVAVLRAFLHQAEEAEVDLILVAGDCFERRSTPRERAALADFLQAAALIAPVFGVKGNHDQAGDLSLFNRLEARRMVYFAELPLGAVPGSAFLWPLKGERFVGLQALPWFDKAHLVSQLEASVDAEASRLMTIEAARAMLTAYRAEAQRLKHDGVVPIFVSHTMVGGSEVSTGQTIIGTTVELAPSDLLDIGAAYVALGHVHKTQEWFDGRVAYSGSPHRCNFGEPEAKGWRLVTLEDDGSFVSNEFRELPARRMVLLEKDWTDSVGQGDDAIATHAELDSMKGALVRWRVHINAQDLAHLDENLVERFLHGAGAAEVQIEAVVEHEARARAPEIVEAKSTLEKVRAFFDAKGIEVGVEQAARLQQKLATLEGSSAAS